jgi:phospholipase/carboxylesterase
MPVNPNLIDGPRLQPASGGTPRQLVILLHGYGSNGADMIQLAPMWRPALPDALFLAPNAPERCGMGGFQWWALSDFSRAALAAGVKRAAPALDALIDSELERHGLEPKDLLLAGFSQGTMMALHVGPCREQAIAGIIGYSGMVADPAGLAEKIRTRPPVLLVHGSADPVVPFSLLGEAERALHRLGLDVTAHEAPGLAHGVDPKGLELGRDFARKVLLGA